MALEIHQIRGILTIMDGELRIEAEPQRIVAQQPRADRVKRPGVRRRGVGGRLRRELARQEALHPPVEFARGAARKRRQHDPLRVGAR